MADANDLYSGFLGAEATRFIGQDTTDIYITSINDPVRIRQRTLALAPGLSVLYTEITLDNGEINANTVWIPWPDGIELLHILNKGPSPPLLPWPVPLDQDAFAVLLDHGLQAVHGIPWFFELEEVHIIPPGGPDPEQQEEQATLHHYEHTKRKRHDQTPKFVVGGKHKEFARLRFGTQLQVYRRGEKD